MADALYTVGLIPAWAGKTPAVSMLYARVPAHPRVGGENTKTRMSPGLTVGSSPRGRGKHFALIDVLFEERLIPAWAGKTILSPGLNCAHRAHPRVGGENNIPSLMAGKWWGSSPRGRGKRDNTKQFFPHFGLIPAWAGKTTGAGLCCWHFVKRVPVPAESGAAHPRVGGENENAPRLVDVSQGSSPRGRGKLQTRV